MKEARDLSHWDGDGFDCSNEELLEMFRDLGFLPNELHGLHEACKREAWVSEKMAKHVTEDQDGYLASSRYFWRRAARWKELAELMDKAIEES